MNHMKLLIRFVAVSCIFLVVSPIVFSQNNTLVTSESLFVSGNPDVRSDRLGVTFINSPDVQSAEERYERASALGAGWTRYPFYWNRIETAPNQFVWDDYDAVVVADLDNDFQINAILLGTPEFYVEDDIFRGLHEPIFEDGSDWLMDPDRLNPNNPWVRYVYETVKRYMPGGTLSTEMGWGADEGIRVWEVWNEPDFELFWQGNYFDYARLLKTAYLVAHMADPDTTIMFGGLLYPTQENWLAQVLRVIVNDPVRAKHNWYMDAIAIHNYSYPWRSGWLALYVNQTLKAYQLERPVWLNESGVAVWDDYPGPVWAESDDQSRINRSTLEQQAWFFIQSTVFAWSEGVDKVFYHQLFDDCGDQPPGTNFPPHEGELCTGDGYCYGDGFGLFRNSTSNVCYSQHPLAGSSRPIALAYQKMASVFGVEDFEFINHEVLDNQVEVFTFQRLQSNQRIVVAWNRSFDETVLELPALASQSTLHTIYADLVLSPDNDMVYRVSLTPALPDQFVDLREGGCCSHWRITDSYCRRR